MEWIAEFKRAEELFQIGELVAAENICLRIFPEHRSNQVLRLIGHIKIRQQNFEEASKYFQLASIRYPSDPFNFSDWALTLKNLGFIEEAIDKYNISLKLKPDLILAHYNKANLLREINAHAEAVKCYHTVITLNPNLFEAYVNLGNTYRDLFEVELALRAYEAALKLKPDSPIIIYNISLCHLQNNNFLEGWKGFEHRWQLPGAMFPSLLTGIPLWNNNLPTEKLLIWAEQGLGDEIFWASLLPQAHKLAAEVWVKIDQRLLALFKLSFPNLKWISGHDNIKNFNFDSHLPMGTLGSIFREDIHQFINSKFPYIFPDTSRIESISQLLINKRKPICGLSWFSKNPTNGAHKSIFLHELLPFLKRHDMTYVNLQYGSVEEELNSLRDLHGIDIINPEEIDKFNDVHSLASLINLCDYVVSTSNSTAHLSGALGKKTYLILPSFGKGQMWYWYNHIDNKSIWYPSIKLTNINEINQNLLNG